jgi:ribulose-phosphate 3-epimerase
MKIAPSILSADFAKLGEDVAAVAAGGADWIHIDVMDGHFVPNITIGPLITEAVKRVTDLPLDVHLMIEAPDSYIDAFAQAGADLITVHVEACRHLHRTVQRIREVGVKAGVAINPGTPIESIGEVAHDLDLVVIMSVNPGFGGQVYIERSTEKVSQARAMLDGIGSAALIEVDGGVGASNARRVAAAGADVLVAGSAVFGHADGPSAGVRAIRTALEG